MIYCSVDGALMMTHPGLPEFWGICILIMMILTVVWAMTAPMTAMKTAMHGAGALTLARLPVVGNGVRLLAANRWVPLVLKLAMVSLFLLVIAAGLFGTPVPGAESRHRADLEPVVGRTDFFDLLSWLGLVRDLSLGCAGAVAGAASAMAARAAEQLPQSARATLAARCVAGPLATRWPDLA